MQYIIMFMLCVIAAICDVITGLCKAHATTGYDSTIMRKGLYCKAINLIVMMFFIAVDVGLEMLGGYYAQEQLAKWAGSISAGFAFAIIMFMEAISIAENFAAANPDSPLAKIIGRKLRKMQLEITHKEENKDENLS